MKDVAGFFHFSSAASTGLVDRLEHLELVQRHHPLGDRRVIIVEPTDKAREIVETCSPEFDTWRDHARPEIQALAATPPNKAGLDPKTRDSLRSRFNTRNPLPAIPVAKMQAKRRANA